MEKALEAGSFREDLYFRLNVFPIVVPPLRERKEDIPLLAEHFAAVYSTKLGRSTVAIPHTITEILLSYSWPGNVRELRNVIESALISSQGDTIDADHLPQYILNGKLRLLLEGNFTDDLKLKAIERGAIIVCLQRANWNKAKAARLLGITRSTLQSKMEKHRIARDRQ